KEILGRAVGKALVTTHLAGAAAQRLVVGTHHVTVRIADRQKLVKRQDQPRLRQNPASQADQLDTVCHEVMEVDDVGLNLLEEIGIGFEQERVRYPVPPMIVVAGQKQK